MKGDKDMFLFHKCKLFIENFKMIFVKPGCLIIFLN